MSEKPAPRERPVRGSENLRADILMSIKPIHMSNIATCRKNHEYRKYLLPSSVHRIWFYTTAPVSSIQYVASVGRGRKPGEVPEDGGIGNEDFNAGRKESKFGYEIQRLWRLCEPISLAVAESNGYLKGPPQKYCWAPAALIEDCPLESQDCVVMIEKQMLSEHKDTFVPGEKPNEDEMKTTNQESIP